MKKILLISLIAVVLIGGLGFALSDNFSGGSDGSKFVASNVLFLSSGITSTQNTITLTQFLVPNTTQEIVMDDFGDVGYITIEPGRTKREFVSFTGITQNSGGTATLTGVIRGLSPIAPYTASTTQQVSHSGGVQVIISNPPQLYNDAAFKANDETITGLFAFTGELPTNPKIATTSSQLVNKAALDASVNQGAATSTESNGGIVELATAIEMASSTDGGADQPLVLQAKHSTSTPLDACDGTSTVGALCGVVAENDGKLNQLWIDLTEAFTWTAAHVWSALGTFNGGLTSTATTTLDGSNVDSNAVVINTQAYSFPTTDGTASSTVLTTDGSGNLTFNEPAKLLSDGTSNGTAATATTTVVTLVIPAGTLDNNDGLRIKALTRSTSNGVKGWEIQWGTGTATSTLLSYSLDSGTNDLISKMDIEIFNNNSGTQKYGFGEVTNTSGFLVASTTNTALIDTSAQTYIAFRAVNTDNDSDSVQYVGITVEKLLD